MLGVKSNHGPVDSGVAKKIRGTIARVLVGRLTEQEKSVEKRSKKLLKDNHVEWKGL